MPVQAKTRYSRMTAIEARYCYGNEPFSYWVDEASNGWNIVPIGALW